MKSVMHRTRQRPENSVRGLPGVAVTKDTMTGALSSPSGHSFDCDVLHCSLRHPELPENWTDTRETLLEGMLFNLKYMGMTLVEEPKGEDLSAAAVKRIVATAKVSGKKLRKVTLKVSPRGIILHDSGTNELIENVSIYRISYCTADKIHDKVFAYIAQNQHNENLECHAFLCTKRKMAQAVTLTVAQAFKVAFELWQASKEEKEKREKSILDGEGASGPNAEGPAGPKGSVATGNLLDLEDAGKSPLTVSTNSAHLENSLFGPSPSVNNNVVWEMEDGLDEAFSRAKIEVSPQERKSIVGNRWNEWRAAHYHSGSLFSYSCRGAN
ncbi:low density lipoprotein receptor adapter protein 1 isoform X2 [Alligator sinensis]|uniref:Low density lipoprotein receptor adapter protein 1 isoform X2 n=1 Tax=Alligator sinensis TaxID=38654 RepID=A0A3Q0G8D2_ALLSI|nr:low density lipoprotein receptor adapter protein 1 isoform X2 [Alligator sinensis]